MSDRQTDIAKLRGSPIAWSDVESLLAQARDFSMTIPEELQMQMMAILLEHGRGFSISTDTSKSPAPIGYVDFNIHAKEF